MILKQLSVKDPPAGTAETFPFSVPAVRSLGTLSFDSAVTYFVGENGTGKSTLLEAIAAAVGSPTVGSEAVARDATLEAQRRLAQSLKLTWSRRSTRGFFLRAEDFFGFAKRMAQLRAELETRLSQVETEFAGASAYARNLAAGPANASLADMKRLYGEDLDARSHGESFLALFSARLAPGGLYLLDEPEAALSPQSQLALLALFREGERDGSQFIVATHSPILLAYPGSCIYSFDRDPVDRVQYAELEHVALTRSFLEDPERYLRRLFD